MIKEYISLKQRAEIEIEEKKSRFIGVAQPLNEPDQAQVFLEEQKNRFPDANHHVYAWRLIKPQKFQRYSDAGEPQGTAGMPVMDVLIKQDIVQAGIIVIRYFGGIKLGAGGLVRAYSKTAALAVEKAKPIFWKTHRIYELSSDYSNAEKVRYHLEQLGYLQMQPVYTDKISWRTAVEPERENQFITLLKDLTGDTIQYKKAELKEFPISK